VEVSSPKKKPSLPHRTDLGNAKFFADLFKNRMRYDHNRRQWWIFKEHWWASDPDGEVMRRAEDATRIRGEIAREISDDAIRATELAWTLQSESITRLQAMVKLAQDQTSLADTGLEWDANPWLLGVANGVVDLKTGTLRKGAPSDRVTLHSSILFDPKAKSPRFEQFLHEVFGDPELVAYIQRAVGYSLTGQTSEQCFFCCYGEGANGKSTFLNAVKRILGEYTYNLPFSALELDARSAIPNDIAALPGRRFVTAIETGDSTELNAARIKALTGGDPITARLLHREFFSFIPTSKFWLCFNRKPVATDGSRGFWRRVHLIPFSQQFVPNKESRLEEILKAEAPGILAWAVRGSLAWQSQGLKPPAIVREATNAYREESDPVYDFIESRCVVEESASVTVGDLWGAYKYWTMDNCEPTSTRTEFNRRLQRLGLEKTRRGHGREWTWLGIRIRTDEDPPGDEPDADKRTEADTKIQ
jgi:putative DNA primase/helicase